MKNIIALIALAFVSFNASAGEIKFTTAEFRVVKVTPTCPAPAPGKMSCMALGATVTLETNIGCMDKLLFSHFELAQDTLVPTIRAVSVVRADSESLAALCDLPVIRKTVTFPDLRGFRVNIENEEVTSY